MGGAGVFRLEEVLGGRERRPDQLLRLIADADGRITLKLDTAHPGDSAFWVKAKRVSAQASPWNGRSTNRAGWRVATRRFLGRDRG